jgi:CheY-like chemotaxis protein
MPAEKDGRAAAPEQLAALGQMMGELIHDLSNEIAVLQGWALLARGEVEAGRLANGEIERVLEISGSAGHMLRDMLETLGGRKLSPEVTFDPLALTEETLSQRIREMSGLTVRLHSLLTPGTRVGGRASFWTRGLGNLLSNAARYARGEIAVSLMEEGGAPGEGRWVVLRVEDDGPGIAPGVRSSVFRPFWRGEDGELGLGLSSAAWAVGQLGGEIEYQDRSVLGGASFVLRVPVAARVVGTPGGSGLPAELRGLRIALVDDDPAVRRALSRLLQRGGAEALELATDGLEPEDLVRGIEALRPDVVLLDLRLGSRGALSVWNCMCIEAPGLTGRVIFMSGASPADADCEQAVHTGQPFLGKPFDLARLGEAIRQLRALE